MLHRPDAPQLWAVVDEAVLRRPIGGPAVMREPDRRADRGDQAAQRHGPGDPVQRRRARRGRRARSRILRFPEPELPDLVYIEQLTSALYLDKRDDVDSYAEAMERLCVEAEPATRTREILLGMREDFQRRLAQDPGPWGPGAGEPANTGPCRAQRARDGARAQPPGNGAVRKCVNEMSRNRAAGYIGGRLVPELLDAGHEVRCMVRSAGRLRDQPWISQVEVAQADASDAEQAARALEGIEVV